MSRRSQKKSPRKKPVPVLPAAAAPKAADARARWKAAGICIFLVALVWIVFGQTLHHEFVNYDDDRNVYANPAVSQGLSLQGISWAFTHTQVERWVPLSTLAHMLDCQLYGLNAGGHHLSSVLLHALGAILLFLVLLDATTAFWRSAFVAALFAIHPLHVEAVAWVSALQYALSGVFFMLTLWAYVGYARHPGSPVRYGALLLLFALGLLSKEMLVTLPFVLLLLDYWPLGRISAFTPKVVLRLVAEKIPLFALTIISCVVTALTPEKLNTGIKLDFALRVENAVVSYAIYLWQMVWSAGQACLYPNPVNHLPLWQVGAALGVLLAISMGVYALRKTRPYLVVGWLWYLGMLVPVIGFVQISNFAHADRYTYLSQIGLYLMLAWGVADLCAGWRRRGLVLGIVSAAIVAALVLCARMQASYWRDSESLWSHTVACTSDNFTAYNNLGDAFCLKGKADQGIECFQKALQINPDYAKAQGNLAVALFQKGRVDEAIGHFQKALQVNPDAAEVQMNFGVALCQKGKVDEAIGHFQKALQINPDSAEVQMSFGIALDQNGRVDEAIEHYQKALQINPDSVETLNNLAWVLATSAQASLRNGARAVELARRATRLTSERNPVILDTLAAAHAEAGQFSEAVEIARRALQLVGTQSNAALAATLKKEIALYRAGLPFHSAEKASSNPRKPRGSQ